MYGELSAFSSSSSSSSSAAAGLGGSGWKHSKEESQSGEVGKENRREEEEKPPQKAKREVRSNNSHYCSDLICMRERWAESLEPQSMLYCSYSVAGQAVVKGNNLLLRLSQTGSE